MQKKCSLSLVAIGPWDWNHLTLLANERLAEDVPIFSAFSSDYHPVIKKLTEEGKVTSLFSFYENEDIPHKQKYEIFAEIVTRAALELGRVIWLVPGNAFVYDSVSGMIVRRCEAQGIDVEIVPGLSSVEAIFCELRADPGARGMQMLNAYLFHEDTKVCTDLPTMLLQVMWTKIRIISSVLTRHYPPDHEVIVVECAGYRQGGRQTRVKVSGLETRLRDMEVAGVNESLVSMYVPAIEAPARRPEVKERTFCRTKHQVVEYPLIEGGLLLVPVQQFSTVRDVADVQVILDKPEYLGLWQLLLEPRTVKQLRERLGPEVASEEHVRHMLIRFFDHGLIDEY